MWGLVLIGLGLIVFGVFVVNGASDVMNDDKQARQHNKHRKVK